MKNTLTHHTSSQNLIKRKTIRFAKDSGIKYILEINQIFYIKPINSKIIKIQAFENFAVFGHELKFTF